MEYIDMLATACSQSDITPCLSLDDLIYIPDEDDVQPPNSPAKAASRSTAMALGFILAKAISASSSLSRMDSRPEHAGRSPMKAVLACGDANELREEEEADTARAVQTILGVLNKVPSHNHDAITAGTADRGLDIRGWTPKNGSPYLDLGPIDALALGQAHTLPRQPHAAGANCATQLGAAAQQSANTAAHAAFVPWRMPAVAKEQAAQITIATSSTFVRGAYAQEITYEKVAMLPVSSAAGREHERQVAFMNARGLSAVPSILEARSSSLPTPIVLSSTLSMQQMSARHRKHGVTQAVSVIAQLRAEQGRRVAPPPPRGGVSPALARSITHIRLAREQAKQQVAYAQMSRGTPSVLARWRTSETSIGTITNL
ncbi:hypothetical protein IEO21_03504 [Rhodonia placenta]|uniref:Uncharacterized protein n=1 Tax=Rhodonia placenta TaxID=104341 RepID=A0A8H7P5W8_9APHY|nr:hypothetical protein IEO21_03504 [Postia placenta]